MPHRELDGKVKWPKRGLGAKQRLRIAVII
jgi:hypothetical protein